MPRVRSTTAGAALFVPERGSLRALTDAVQHCRGCELYRNATQAVFGGGPVHARVMLVGEQPGDQEDKRGAPFVGPAGRILDRALDDAGIDRSTVYVTDAVKHFKFVEQGKRRIHQKPTFAEITACRPWLEMATPLAPKTIATVHPSAILRGDDEDAQAEMYATFVDDLSRVGRALARAA